MTKSNLQKVLVTAGFSIVLASCASDGGARARYNESIDWNKVHQVDIAALNSNVQVIWVNPPQNKKYEK